MTVADFLVDSILDDGLVVGKNGYIDVPLHTVFTELVLTRVDGTPPDFVSVELGAVASVRLTVREVENKFFRKPLVVIPRGHMAELRWMVRALNACAKLSKPNSRASSFQCVQRCLTAGRWNS